MISPSPEISQLDGPVLPLPSEALNRFRLPTGFRHYASEDNEVDIRYGFRVGDLNFLIPERLTSEVVTFQNPASMPNSPPWLFGVISVRGMLVSLVDIAQLYENAPARRLNVCVGPNREAIAILLGSGDRIAGLHIDGLPCALHGLRASQHVPQLPELLRRSVTAAWAGDDELWLDFSHENLLTELATSAG